MLGVEFGDLQVLVLWPLEPVSAGPSALFGVTSVVLVAGLQGAWTCQPAADIPPMLSPICTGRGN